MVLLIDDDKGFLNLIKYRLEEINIKVDIAESFAQSKDLFDNKYRVIVADMRLNGDITGLTIIKLYKSLNPKAHSILYSGGEIEDDTDSHDCVDRFITKEVMSTDNLINCIKSFYTDDLEPQILEVILSDIAAIKAKLKEHDKKLNEVLDVSKDIKEIKIQVSKFIADHQNDPYKIVGAIALLVTLSVLIIKLGVK